MIRNTVTVAKREVRSLVDQPTAYVLAIAFLGVSLYLTFRNMYAVGAASLRPLFDLLPLLFAVFVPAITMRSLAEEQRSHTLGWLLSQPLGEWEAVAGKFLGSWVFVLIVLGGTIPTGIGVVLVSDADPGILVAQYLGGALLAAEITAIGVWASSITRNQITSFIVAAVIAFTLFLIGLPGIQLGIPPVVAGILVPLSVVGHFENVARGVVDLRDVIYFLSTTLLFVVLAVGAVARSRLSPAGPDARRLRLGTAVVALIVIALNLVGGQIHGRIDLTRDQLFTLSPGTRDILAELDDLVQITLFASDELPPEVQLQARDVRDLLSDMRRSGGGTLRVTETDPDEDEAAAERATSLGIAPLEFNVLRDDEFEVRRGWYGLAVTYADEQEVYPAIQRTDDLEYRLISAIARMTADRRQSVFFATESGSRPAAQMPGVQEILGDRYDLVSGPISGDSVEAPSPSEHAVMVLAGPNETLSDSAVQVVESFVAGGGAALLLLDPLELDPQTGAPLAIESGLDALLEERGVRVVDSLVVDLASAERVNLGQQGFFSVVAAYPLWPITLPAGDHVLTRGMNALSLGWAGALEITDPARATPLWVTSEAGGLRDASLPIDPQQEWDLPQNQLGVRVVGAALDASADSTETAVGDPGRIVVVRDATFSELEFLQSNPQNLTFLANAVDWLAQEESLIRIRSKDRTPPALVFTSDGVRELLRWGNLAGMPLLFVLVGLVRVGGRRRRAEAKWKEVVEP